MTGAAFFDIDRTLIAGTSLEMCFLRLAWRERAVGPAALLRNLWAGLQALGLIPGSERLVIPPGLATRTRLRYAFVSGNKAYLRGMPLERAQALAGVAFQQVVRARVSRRAQETVDCHRAAGRRIVLLTGTLDFLGQPLRDYLQADHLLAARPQVRGGLLTGRLAAAHPYGAEKRRLLLHFAHEQDLDLAASYAYADHHTDIAFLETVGHPVAVNPDRGLQDAAEQRGWEVAAW